MFKRSDLILKLQIGHGAYGRVYIGEHRQTGLEVAVKASRKSKFHSKYLGQLIFREKKLFEKIINPSQNPFIIKLFGICQNNKYILSVYELCKGGDLNDLINREGKLSENDIRFYAGSLVLAIEFLHKNKIVHRDLKPGNVLLDSRGFIKVTDFGFARLSYQKFLKSVVNTPGYCAPEIYRHRKYTNSVDWWSLGAIIHKMLTGEVPFENYLSQTESEATTYYDSEFTTRLSEATLRYDLRISSRYSRNISSLIHGLLEKLPSKRLSNSVDVKDKGYFRGFDWDALEHGEIAPPFPNPRYGKLYRQSKRNGRKRNIDDLHGVKLNLPRCFEPDEYTKAWQVEKFRKDLNFVSDQWKDMVKENLAQREKPKKAVRKYQNKGGKIELQEDEESTSEESEEESDEDSYESRSSKSEEETQEVYDSDST